MKKALLSLFALSLLVMASSALVFARGAQGGGAQAPAKAEAPAKKSTKHVARAHIAVTRHSLSGTLTMVDTTKRVVVVSDSDGVPFNFKVTRGTRIEVNGQKATLADLSGQTNKQVSVKYLDRMEEGMFANSITVSE